VEVFRSFTFIFPLLVLVVLLICLCFFFVFCFLFGFFVRTICCCVYASLVLCWTILGSDHAFLWICVISSDLGVGCMLLFVFIATFCCFLSWVSHGVVLVLLLDGGFRGWFLFSWILHCNFGCYDVFCVQLCFLLWWYFFCFVFYVFLFLGFSDAVYVASY